MWVIPPEPSGALVAPMEDVLAVYQRPYDPPIPRVCLEAQPVPLMQAVKHPLPAEEGKPERYD
jgi:hypothetical protein